jgi:hypothetical protein
MVCRALSNYALRRKLAFFATKLIFDPNHKKKQKIAQFYVPPLLINRMPTPTDKNAYVAGAAHLEINLQIDQRSSMFSTGISKVLSLKCVRQSVTSQRQKTLACLF